MIRKKMKKGHAMLTYLVVGGWVKGDKFRVIQLLFMVVEQHKKHKL